MKKVIFIAAAVVAMSACSKVETKSVSVSEEIGFYTISQNATKGYIDGTGFYEYENPNNTTIGGGFNNTSDVMTTSTARDMFVSAYNVTDGNDYFTSKTFAKTGSEEIWHGSPEIIYWPIGKDLTFLAYSSKNIAGRDDVVANWESAKKVSFDVTPEQCYQNDIVYGQASGNNRGTAAGKNGSSSTAGLPITFYHSQAWITFNVFATGADADKEVIDVTNIVMENVYNSGVLSFEYDETASPAKPVAKWDFFTQNPTDVSVDDPWNNAFGKGNVKIDGAKNGFQVNMLMPAQKHNDFVLYYTANGVEDSVVLPFTADFSTEDKGVWEMGKHYIYNVLISINELTFAPEVKIWDNVIGFEENPQVI